MVFKGGQCQKKSKTTGDSMILETLSVRDEGNGKVLQGNRPLTER
jgi:hypothetical protein